jgi:hypothetical protein
VGFLFFLNHPQRPRALCTMNGMIVCKFFMKIILRKTGEKGYLKSIDFAVDWKKSELLL